MVIYQLVFGIDRGQVQCVFHDDQRASAGIGPNGEYNCFACGAKHMMKLDLYVSILV